MTIEEIIFDDREQLSYEEKIDYLLVQIAVRIMSYMEDAKYQHDRDNSIIRVADDTSIPENKIIDVEEITIDMIK